MACRGTQACNKICLLVPKTCVCVHVCVWGGCGCVEGVRVHAHMCAVFLFTCVFWSYRDIGLVNNNPQPLIGLNPEE